MAQCLAGAIACAWPDGALPRATCKASSIPKGPFRPIPDSHRTGQIDTKLTLEWRGTADAATARGQPDGVARARAGRCGAGQHGNVQLGAQPPLGPVHALMPLYWVAASR